LMTCLDSNPTKTDDRDDDAPRGMTRPAEVGATAENTETADMVGFGTSGCRAMRCGDVGRSQRGGQHDSRDSQSLLAILSREADSVLPSQHAARFNFLVDLKHACSMLGVGHPWCRGGAPSAASFGSRDAFGEQSGNRLGCLSRATTSSAHQDARSTTSRF
jgi:hypothetical protein